MASQHGTVAGRKVILVGDAAVGKTSLGKGLLLAASRRSGEKAISEKSGRTRSRTGVGPLLEEASGSAAAFSSSSPPSDSAVLQAARVEGRAGQDQETPLGDQEKRQDHENLAAGAFTSQYHPTEYQTKTLVSSTTTSSPTAAGLFGEVDEKTSFLLCDCGFGGDHVHRALAGYFRDARLALLVYDVTSFEDTFDGVKHWHRQILGNPRECPDCVMLVVGCKADGVEVDDLQDDKNKVKDLLQHGNNKTNAAVKEQHYQMRNNNNFCLHEQLGPVPGELSSEQVAEVADFCDEMRLLHFFTSAKTGLNLSALLTQISSLVALTASSPEAGTMTSSGPSTCLLPNSASAPGVGGTGMTRKVNILSTGGVPSSRNNYVSTTSSSSSTSAEQARRKEPDFLTQMSRKLLFTAPVPKILVVGGFSVGKTTLIQRWQETAGAAVPCYFQEYLTLPRILPLHKATPVIFVYDVTKLESVQYLQQQRGAILTTLEKNAGPILVLGLKYDLVEEQAPAVANHDKKGPRRRSPSDEEQNDGERAVEAGGKGHQGHEHDDDHDPVARSENYRRVARAAAEFAADLDAPHACCSAVENTSQELSLLLQAFTTKCTGIEPATSLPLEEQRLAALETKLALTQRQFHANSKKSRDSLGTKKHEELQVGTCDPAAAGALQASRPISKLSLGEMTVSDFGSARMEMQMSNPGVNLAKPPALWPRFSPGKMNENSALSGCTGVVESGNSNKPAVDLLNLEKANEVRSRYLHLDKHNRVISDDHEGPVADQSFSLAEGEESQSVLTIAPSMLPSEHENDDVDGVSGDHATRLPAPVNNSDLVLLNNNLTCAEQSKDIHFHLHEEKINKSKSSTRRIELLKKQHLLQKQDISILDEDLEEENSATVPNPRGTAPQPIEFEDAPPMSTRRPRILVATGGSTEHEVVGAANNGSKKTMNHGGAGVGGPELSLPVLSPAGDFVGGAATSSAQNAQQVHLMSTFTLHSAGGAGDKTISLLPAAVDDVSDCNDVTQDFSFMNHEQLADSPSRKRDTILYDRQELQPRTSSSAEADHASRPGLFEDVAPIVPTTDDQDITAGMMLAAFAPAASKNDQQRTNDADPGADEDEHEDIPKRDAKNHVDEHAEAPTSAQRSNPGSKSFTSPSKQLLSTTGGGEDLPSDGTTGGGLRTSTSSSRATASKENANEGGPQRQQGEGMKNQVELAAAAEKAWRAQQGEGMKNQVELAGAAHVVLGAAQPTSDAASSSVHASAASSVETTLQPLIESAAVREQLRLEKEMAELEEAIARARHNVAVLKAADSLSASKKSSSAKSSKLSSTSNSVLAPGFSKDNYGERVVGHRGAAGNKRHAVDDEGMLCSRTKGITSRYNKSASSTASSSRRSRSDAGTSAAAAASKLAYKTTKNFRKSRFVAATDGVGGPAEEQKERHADELLVPQDSNSNSSSLSIKPTPRGSTPATSARASVKEQVKNYARQLAGAKSESKGARRTGIGSNYLGDQHAHAEDHLHTPSSTSGRAGFHCSPRGDGGSSFEAAGTETTDEVGATSNFYMTTHQRPDVMLKNQDPSSSSSKSKSSSSISGAALASARNNVPDNSAAPPKSSARSSSGLQNSQNLLFTRHSVRAELLARPTMNSTAKARNKIDQQNQYYQESPAKLKQPSSSSLSPAKGKQQVVGTNNDKLAVLPPSSAQKQTASSAAAVSQNFRQSRTRTGGKGKRSNAEAATGSVPKALQRGLCPAGGPDQDLRREFRRNSAGRLAPHQQTGLGTAVEQDYPPPSSSRLSSTLRSSIVSKSRSSTGTKLSRSGSKSFNTGDPTPGDWTQDMRRQLSFALGGGPGGPGASVNGPPAHGRPYMMGGSSYQQNNMVMAPTMNKNNLEQEHDHQHKQTAQEQLPGAAAPHAGTTASTAVLRNCDGLGLIQFQFNPVARGSGVAPSVNSSNSCGGQHQQRVVVNTNIASRASLLNVRNVVEHQQGQHSHSNSQAQLAADQTAVTNVMTGSSTTSALGKILQAPALAPSLAAREQQQQQQRSYQFRSLSPPPGGRSLLNCDNQGTNGKTLNGGAAASSSAQPHMKMTSSNPVMINNLNTRAGALSPPIATRRPEPVHSSQSQFQPLTVSTGRACRGVGGFPGSQKALPRQVSAEAPEPPAFVGPRMNKRQVETMAVVKDKKSSNHSWNKEQSAASSATDVGGAGNIKKPVPKHKESSSFRTRNRNAQTGRDHAAVDHKKSSGRQYGGIKAGGVGPTSTTGNGKSLYGARNNGNKNNSAADNSLENTQQMLIKSARAYSTPPTSSRGGRNEDVGQQQQQDQNQRQNFLQHHVQLNLNIPTFPQQQQQQPNNFATGAPILPTGIVQHPSAAHQNVNMWHPAARTGGTVNSMSCLQNTNEGRALELEQQQFPTQYVSAATTTSFLHQQLSPQLHTRNMNAVGASINNNFPTNQPAAGSTFKRFCSPQMQSRASVGTTNNLHGQNDPQRQRQNGVFRQMSAHPRARAVAGTVRENKNLQEVELEAGHNDMNGKQKQFSGQQISTEPVPPMVPAGGHLSNHGPAAAGRVPLSSGALFPPHVFR